MDWYLIKHTRKRAILIITQLVNIHVFRKLMLVIYNIVLDQHKDTQSTVFLSSFASSSLKKYIINENDLQSLIDRNLYILKFTLA